MTKKRKRNSNDRTFSIRRNTANFPGGLKKKIDEGKIPPEKYWNKKVGEIIRSLSLFTYKTAEKFYYGIPDQYVAGGNWIELKKIPVTKWVSPLRFFDTRQVRILNNTCSGGDRGWVLIIWQIGARSNDFDEEPVRITLMEWPRFQRLCENGRLMPDQIMAASVPREKLSKLMMDNFGSNFDRNSNYDPEAPLPKP